MPKKQIHVNLQDIKKAKPCEPMRCPIALAAIRAGLDVKIGVGEGVLSIADPKSIWIDIPLPAEAIKFYQDFDDGKPVSPFSFEIELPESDKP